MALCTCSGEAVDNFSLAEQTTTLKTTYNIDQFEEYTTENIADIITIVPNNDEIITTSEQEQQSKVNVTTTIRNETHNEDHVKNETEENSTNEQNTINETRLPLNGDFDNTQTFNENQHNDAMPPIVEENHSENINETFENADDVDNDIFSILEKRPGSKKSQDFINSQTSSIDFTGNLEESIRNSVKNDIEMEQRLESSPVLEILKDIPEPEIREILKGDLRIDHKILNENNFKWGREKSRSFEIDSDYHQTKSQSEIKNIVSQELVAEMEKESHKGLENVREIRNPNLEQNSQKEGSGHVDSMQDSVELNSGEKNTVETKSNELEANREENEEEIEGSGLKSDIYIQIADSSNEINVDKTNISDMAELDHLEEKKSSSEENDALSVVLDESLTSSLTEPDEQQNLLNLEREEAASMQQELEEATTLTTEQTEHMVIKKVLDMRDILEMQSEIPETTSSFEGKEENESYSQTDESNDFKFVTTVTKPQERLEEKSQEHIQNSLNEFELVGSGIDPHTFETWQEEADSLDKERLNNVKGFADNSDSPRNRLEINVDDQSHFPGTEQIENNRSNETFDLKGSTEEAVTVTVQHESNQDKYQTLTESQLFVKSKELKSRSKDESVQLEEDNEQVHHLQEEPPRMQNEVNAKQEEEKENTFWSSTTEYLNSHSTENDLINAHMAVNLYTHDTRSTTQNDLDIEYSSRTAKESRSINTAAISTHNDRHTATLFESYPPHNAGQTFNNNLAAETSGIGKALPVSVDGTSRSTVIIILSSGTAFLFIIVSVTIFLISFQRQHGTLDIEMQERSCGKDNLDEEDAETFTKLLEIELPSQVAVALEETEECL
uniref:Uncharacterized protein n=1 Tax=Glossina brevipalpis TaxID=37001 RepID=A0A1A9W5Z1_9MUSC